MATLAKSIEGCNEEQSVVTGLPRIERLNYGYDASGDQAAAMRSLIGWTEMNGLAPSPCPRHVTTHLPDHSMNRIDDMLFWKVAL